MRTLALFLLLVSSATARDLDFSDVRGEVEQALLSRDVRAWARKLADAPTQTDPLFGFETITECPGVPSDAMIPRENWRDPAAYDANAQKLAELFLENFKTYQDGASADILNGGPSQG